MKKLVFLCLYVQVFLSIFAFEERGVASWYGPNFHGKLTANGERFNTYSLTAAHKTLPLGSVVKVISEVNGKEVIVRINDRGPFAKNRIIDLSKAAAVKLDMLKHGTAAVKVILLKEGDNAYYRYKKVSYTIQAGSFSNKDSASQLQGKINAHGGSSTVKQVSVQGRTLYRVEIPNLTYGGLHPQKLALHNAGIHDYLVRKIEQ